MATPATSQDVQQLRDTIKRCTEAMILASVGSVEEALKRWVNDCEDRPGDAKPRVVTIQLTDCTAEVRFISVEPLLGPLDLKLRGMNAGVDWVIVGGESGPNARPMHPDWARSIRDQCLAAGVPFFFKQWGEHIPADKAHWSEDQVRNSFNPTQKKSKHYDFYRVGKKTAGRILDGRTWDEMPEVSHAGV
jgi:protein gp37